MHKAVDSSLSARFRLFLWIMETKRSDMESNGWQVKLALNQSRLMSIPNILSKRISVHLVYLYKSYNLVLESDALHF